MGLVQGAMVDRLNMDVLMMYAYIQNEGAKINKVEFIDSSAPNYLFIVTFMFHEYKATFRKANDIYICIHISLRWRHNGRDCSLFRRRSKKTSQFRVTGLCAGISPGTGEFPAQMASNAEYVSIWWRHHDCYRFMQRTICLCGLQFKSDLNSYIKE